MNGVYLVTDRTLVGGAGLIEAVTKALEGGVRLVQLREKDLGGRDLLILAKKLRSVTNDFGARLFINGRVDAALLSGADGVHLGQKSFSPKEARALKKGLLIGVSTHSIEEARAAFEEGADFITVGPVYRTPSKAAYGEPAGVELIRKVKYEVDMPVFAIGGIKKENISEALCSGADGVAVISGILASPDIKKSAEEFIKEFELQKNLF